MNTKNSFLILLDIPYLVNLSKHKHEATLDFRTRATQGVALAALILLSPFSFNQFYQGNFLIGTGSLIIVILVGINAWSCVRGQYNPMLTYVGLAPATILFLVFSFHELGLIIVFWYYPAVFIFYCMLPEKKAWIVNIVFLAVTLPNAWYVLESSIVIRLTVTLIAVSTFAAIFVRVITSQQSKLEAQAVTDPLTGLFNRTLLHDTLEHAIQQNHRMHTPMTLIALDLDRFKAINDSLGHDAGDTVLRRLGEFLHGRIRRSDKVFRLGGEEFLAVLYDTDTANGLQLAEDIRKEIESLPILPDRNITVSIGVASLQPNEGWEQWMKRCDENMYRAKSNGRNFVVA